MYPAFVSRIVLIVNTDILDTGRDTKSRRNKHADRLSPDGKWRSFAKVPNLLQYASTGQFFARVKVNGKLIRRSLQVATFEEARLALHDFLAKETKVRHVVGAPVTFAEARGLYESSLTNDPTLSEKSRYYRRNCIKRLLKSWPELDAMKPRAITRLHCEKWAGTLAAEVDAQYFNNILGTFKAILERASIGEEASPLHTIKRMGIQLVPPTLPEPEQFLKIIETM